MGIYVDSHQHFWRLSRSDYGWLTPELDVLYRDFQPSDLEPHLRDASIPWTVLVQAAPTVSETVYLLALADKCDFVAGVVGWINMENGADAISDLLMLAENKKFVGIRPMIQDIEDPKWMLNEQLTPVFDALVEHNLCFDALVKPEHLPHLITLLKRHPMLKAVVDHGAKPAITDCKWEPWADDIGQITKETGAYCKLSGLISEASPDQGFDDLWPYYDHLLNRFGPARLMWGSDWPVLNHASDYAAWFETCQSWLSELSSDDQQRIMGDTAIRFYNLTVA